MLNIHVNMLVIHHCSYTGNIWNGYDEIKIAVLFNYREGFHLMNIWFESNISSFTGFIQKIAVYSVQKQNRI